MRLCFHGYHTPFTTDNLCSLQTLQTNEHPADQLFLAAKISSLSSSQSQGKLDQETRLLVRDSAEMSKSVFLLLVQKVVFFEGSYLTSNKFELIVN